MEIFLYRKGAAQVEEGFTEKELPALLADETNVVWVDLHEESQGHTELNKNVLLNIFKFHYLTVEDCLETRNQPKVEAFPDYIYFIVHGIKPEATNPTNFTTKELDGYLGKNFIVTFHSERFRSIKTVKQQIRNNSYHCQRGAAYLLHQILDQLVDLYMPVVDDFENAINTIEDRVFKMRKSDNKLLEEIMDLRRSVVRMKRISVRQLDVLYRMSNGEFPQIPSNIIPFYRDVHDHLLRISDLSESYRDLVNGLFDIHFSVTAGKTNEVMKVLAVFSSIMLPLTLIAGVYGMNFDNMPELHSPYGYFGALALMFIVGAGLMVYFWRKGWIFEGKEDVLEVDAEQEIHTTRINE
jgi:magnesium transporter